MCVKRKNTEEEREREILVHRGERKAVTPVSHANMQYVSVFRFFLRQGRVSRPRLLWSLTLKWRGVGGRCLTEAIRWELEL